MEIDIRTEAKIWWIVINRIFIRFQRFEIKDWEFLWRSKLLRDGKIIDESMDTDVSYESQFTQGSLDIDKIVLIT